MSGAIQYLYDSYTIHEEFREIEILAAVLRFFI
jgi:hypothetical protein